jgi:putative redox protein
MGVAKRRPSEPGTARIRPVTSIRHIAHAVGHTGANVPAYQVDLHAGRHQLTADEPIPGGGTDAGPSPFGLLLSALAACTATTLRMYADRNGWELASIEVDVRYDVRDDGRAEINRTVTVPVDLALEHRQRLAEIAERTPVTLALRAGTPISTILQPSSR